MKFGPVPVAQAEGGILAHSLPELGLRKGCVLGGAEMAALQAQGVAEVVIARLEDGDVDENIAATRLGRAFVPDGPAQGLSLAKATAGRVNILAERPGLVDLDVPRLQALNAVDPMITCATVPHLRRIEPKGLIATIKIIPYAVPEASLAAACDVAKGAAPAITVLSARRTTATLIETHIGQPLSYKGEKALRMRLERLGVALTEVVSVPHEVGAIAQAVAEATSHMIFILTAAATSDIHDTAPEGVRAAGAKVLHYGMPVDPGNLMFMGRRTSKPFGAIMGERPIIGLPGCARSPALNGADFVLERVICGVPITPADIMAMGVGGLLKETPMRGRPRE